MLFYRKIKQYCLIGEDDISFNSSNVIDINLFQYPEYHMLNIKKRNIKIRYISLIGD